MFKSEGWVHGFTALQHLLLLLLSTSKMVNTNFTHYSSLRHRHISLHAIPHNKHCRTLSSPHVLIALPNLRFITHYYSSLHHASFLIYPPPPAYHISFPSLIPLTSHLLISLYSHHFLFHSHWHNCNFLKITSDWSR